MVFKSNILKPYYLGLVNRILAIFLIVVLGYLLYAFLFPEKLKVSSLIQEIDIEPALEERSTTLPKIDFTVYSKAIEGKKIFTAPVALKKVDVDISSKDVDISKRFGLVGIIAGDKPQAIIEDKETQKNYYLYKGQSFDGILMEEINKGKVILDYEGEKITLVL